MLYLLRNLRTTLHFAESQIDQVGSTKQVWNKLRQKIQGKCTNQCGMIVQVPNPQFDGADSKIQLPIARINDRGGCSFQIQFSAIGFKAQKNDLMKVRVSEIAPDYIECMIGPVQIKIPKCKIDGQFQYDKSLHCFRMINKNYKIDVGDIIYCKCFQSRIIGGEYKIIGELPSCLVPINIKLK